MNYTIDESGELVRASLSRAHQYLEAATGKRLPTSVLANSGWADAELAANGVRRLDIVTVGPVNQYTEVGLETLAVNGDRATLTLAYAYSELATVQAIKTREVRNYAIEVLDGGTEIGGQPVATDERALSVYWAMDTWRNQPGNSWPAGGVNFNLMNGDRIKITESQFDTVLQNVTQHVYAANNRMGGLLDQIDGWNGTAEELANAPITGGWPDNPDI